jgi:nucleoid-associated protein YgaU
MGNFEKLSVLVIVVIIVMILVVALYTWTDNPADGDALGGGTASTTSEGAMPDPILSPEPVKSGAASLPWPIQEPKVTKIDVSGLPTPAPTPPPSVPPKTDDAGASPAPAPEAAPAERFYVVKEGETPGGIAQAELGSARRWKEILDLNPGVQAERLQPGMRLKMPGAAAGGAPTPKGAEEGIAKASSSGPAAGAAKPGATYTVQSGDTLEKISKRVYGTSSRWPEIWVANLAKLDSPDDVRRGMELQLPR